LLIFIILGWEGIARTSLLFTQHAQFSSLFWPQWPAQMMLGIGYLALCVVLLRDLLVDYKESLQIVGRRAWLWITIGILVGAGLCFMPWWYSHAGLSWSAGQWSIIAITAFFVIMVLGMPLGAAMALIGFVGVGCMIGLSGGFNLLGTTPFSRATNFDFSVMPLFILMGMFAFHSEVISDLFFSVSKWVGQLRGGLALACLAGCAGFAAVCGSSLASTAAMANICYPQLKKYKYDPALSTGVIAAGGTLGIMIPPSMDFVVFGVLTSTSIGALLIAGILPGFLMCFLFGVAVLIICRLKPLAGPKMPISYSWVEKLKGTLSILPILALFLVVIGGIYLGIFTPTEGAGVGSFGAFVIALARKKLNLRKFFSSLVDSTETTSMILILFIGAMMFGYFLTLTGVPLKLASFLSALSLNRYIVISLVLVVYVVLGCVMDAFAILIITIPIIFPAIMQLGFDPIWFGVLMVMMDEFGMISPPFGMAAFVCAGVTKVPVGTVFKGILPFVAADIVVLALVMAFPSIATFLPNLMMK
jgi:C4-dicarboxylate transporter, DctM subunit